MGTPKARGGTTHRRTGRSHGNVTGGKAFTGKPDFTPGVKHGVPSTTVVCPDCKAGIGERCVSLTTGNPTTHISRKRIAIRTAAEKGEPLSRQKARPNKVHLGPRTKGIDLTIENYPTWTGHITATSDLAEHIDDIDCMKCIRQVLIILDKEGGQ